MDMQHGRSVLILVALMFVLTACGGAAMQAPANEAGAPAPAAMATAAPAATEAPAAVEGSGDSATDTSEQSEQPRERLVIRNASLSVEVENVSQAEARLRAQAEQLGGYVVSVQTYGSNEDLVSTITFRVPAENFEEALSGVEGLALEVFSRNVSGEDVTEEFVDLESRLRNLEATSDRLLDLLDKATRVEDALSVNQALTDVQGQIEQIRGRMQFLSQSAAFSTITAELRPVPLPPAIVGHEGWQPLNVAREALGGLVEFGQGLVNFAIVLLVWTPIWLPLLLLGRWGLRRLSRSVRNAPPRTPPPPPTPPTVTG
jgi:hypothetical protein